MHEYDDLFTKNSPVPEIKPNSPDPVFDAETFLKENRINRWLIILYFGIQILLAGVVALYYQYEFPDPNALYSNIVAIDAPAFTIVDDDTDPEYPYLVTITGTIANQNTRSLPMMIVSVEFYYEGEYLDTIDITQENVAAGEIFEIDEYYYFSLPIDEIQYTYNFNGPSILTLILNFAQSAILGLAFLFIDRQNFKKDWKTFKSDLSNHIGKIILGFLMVYAAMIVSNLLLELLGASDTSLNEETIASMFTSDPLRLIGLFLMLCILTPIVEEVIFRKVLFGFLDRKFGYIIAILISGAIFGLMHVIAYGDFVQSIPYIMMGGVFGFVYHWSNKNIYVTIGVHFINNLIAYLIYFAAVMGFTLF